MTTLAEFLKGEAEKLRAGAAERVRMRDEWIEAVDHLTHQIEDWLQQANTEGVLSVERTSVEVREHKLGFYTASALVITLGDVRIRVVPVARNVLGPWKDERVPNGRWQGLVNLTDGVQKYQLYRSVDSRGEQWVIVDDKEYIPAKLTQERFEAALMDLLK